MGRLLLYNPENDTALASGLKNFTPGREPSTLAHDGGLLAFWWANDGDMVCTVPGHDSAIQELKIRFGLQGEVFNHVVDSPTAVEPWGWSPYTKSFLRRTGVNDDLLPDDLTLNSIRELSHRRTAIGIHQALGTPSEFCPVEAKSVEHAMDAISRWGGDAVIKQPWSSSGRGVFFTSSLPSPLMKNYVEGFIRKQGSVIIEPRRNKTQDFALLYYSDGKTVEYRGLSIFKASHKGQYEGNMVETDDVLLNQIGLSLGRITENIGNALKIKTLPHYKGWIGVDMMTERLTDGSQRIVPCVEVNLRMTMGVVAHIIAERHPELRGRMLRLQSFPPVDDDISLSPVENAKYHYVLTRKLL